MTTETAYKRRIRELSAEVARLLACYARLDARLANDTSTT